MDESEFKRLLDLFPVVRSRDYHPDSDLKESTSGTTQDEQLTEWQNDWDLDEGNTKETEVLGINHQDMFWEKLKLAAEKKVGPESAEKFCKAFQTIYKKLVFNELSEDAAQRFINSTASSRG